MTDSPTSESLSVRDNRTGREYEIAITDGTIRAADLKQIAVDGEPGLATYDPGFVNTASCRSAITFIDGDVGMLLERKIPFYFRQCVMGYRQSTRAQLGDGGVDRFDLIAGVLVDIGA